MDRIIGIGDIHGNYNALSRLLDVIKFSPQDKDMLVFLGDYIDRGNKNKKVIKALVDLKMQFPANVVLLKGNHELMAEDAFCAGEDSEEMRLWKRNGGTETLKSYGDFETARRELSPFIACLPLFHEIEQCIFVHAGFPVDVDGVPRRDIAIDDVNVLVWERNTSDYSKKLLVIGHTPHKTPTKYNSMVVVDTAAYKTDLLCGYDIMDNMVYESTGSIYSLYQQDKWGV